MRLLAMRQALGALRVVPFVRRKREMMTPEQVELARHALGLPNDTKRSYRNYFTCGEHSPDFAVWQRMVSNGDAISEKRKGFGGDSIFWLMEDGARKALKPGETLDMEDYPERLRSAQHASQ
jgi:hypothetical protein